MFLNWLDGREEEFFLCNGGRSTLRYYGISPHSPDRVAQVPSEHLDFFRSLLPYYDTETYLFVHAGVRPGIPMELAGSTRPDLDPPRVLPVGTTG